MATAAQPDPRPAKAPALFDAYQMIRFARAYHAAVMREREGNRSSEEIGSFELMQMARQVGVPFKELAAIEAAADRDFSRGGGDTALNDLFMSPPDLT
ncbi:hypothetical protein [Aldersonia kunmingensis]|uniref:hypothetical protein n=1 Tax=Aldersonia kunmingensis TaxID=408066 RepID=UPI00082BBFF7|nr:hypothetical protein [Aldersonia kunmingensis]